MLARHAENLMWAGRYLERAEVTARMVDVTYHSQLESPSTEVMSAWSQLLEVLNLEYDYGQRHGTPGAPGDIIAYLVNDPDNPGSILTSVTRARDNLRGVRELISAETWEATNTLYLSLRGRDLSADLDQPYDLFAAVKLGAQLVAGVANDTMVHDDGWRFFTLGRMLERVEMTCRLLVIRLASLEDARTAMAFHEGSAILKSVSASEAFRKTHRTMDAMSVVEFVLLSSNFPRAVLYCLRSAEVQLDSLGHGSAGNGSARRRLGRLRSGVEYRNVDDLLEVGIEPFLEGVQDEVREIADAVADEFFRYAEGGTLQTVTAP